MKKIVALLLVFALLLAGCGKSDLTWQEHYELGLRYLSEGNYEEAILAFNAAIEIHPKRAEAYVQLAEIYTVLGDEEKLSEIMDLAAQQFGEEEFAKLLLGEETEDHDAPENDPAEEPDKEPELLLKEFLGNQSFVAGFTDDVHFKFNDSGIMLILKEYTFPEGILCYDIRDLDFDKETELFTAEIKNNTLCLCVYEAERESVKKASEIVLCDDMRSKFMFACGSFEKTIFVKQTTDAVLLCHDSYFSGGVFANPKWTGIASYIYQNNELQKAIDVYASIGAGENLTDPVKHLNDAIVPHGFSPVADNYLGHRFYTAEGITPLATFRGKYTGTVEDADTRNLEDPEEIPPLRLTVETMGAPAGTEQPAEEPALGGAFGEGLSWKLENGVLTVSGQGKTPDFNPPDTPSPWADYRSQVRKVVVEKGITELGWYNFDKMENLTEIQIADTVEHLGYGTFVACKNLTHVELPDSITYIGWDVFFNCTNLQSIDLPENLITLSSNVFHGCESLKTIRLPESLNQLSWECFSECSNLTAVYFEGDAPLVNYECFRNTPEELTLYFREGKRGWTSPTWESYSGEVYNTTGQKN